MRHGGAAALVAAGLVAALGAASAQDEPVALAQVASACDFGGRCLDFAGGTELLARAGASLRHADPLALANGTPGEPIVQRLADDD